MAAKKESATASKKPAASKKTAAKATEAAVEKVVAVPDQTVYTDENGLAVVTCGKQTVKVTAVKEIVKKIKRVDSAEQAPIEQVPSDAATEQVAEAPAQESAAPDAAAEQEPVAEETVTEGVSGIEVTLSQNGHVKIKYPAYISQKGIVLTVTDGNDQPVQDVTVTEDILEVQSLKKYFPIKKSFFGKTLVNLRAVDDVSFSVERGTTIGVVGESGCGKTTLGRTILKLYEPDGGKMYFNGDDITDLKRRKMLKYRTRLQLIFQDPYSSLPPRMSVGNIIAEAVKVHKIVPKSEVKAYVRQIMKQCGLQLHYYDRYPHEFSGGQRQRICIARALAVKPELVICDEPVSALDVSIQAQIINLLKDLQKEQGLTYVFISHDLSVVKYITDKIMVMYLGSVMETGATDDIFDNPLHPYTVALFSAVPVPDPDIKMKRIILKGDIPSPANPPSGCKFHTRCDRCMNVCKMLEPKNIEYSKGHFVKCHLYDDEVMKNLSQYDEEYEKQEALRLEKEQLKKKKRNN